MRLPIWQRAARTPWAITEDHLRNILQIAQRDTPGPEAVAQQTGEKLENTYDVEYRDGVAILSIKGPLFRYANLFTAISGATSYERIAKDFFAALNDNAVKAVLLDIDSPGGEANGCAELAQQIYQGRGVKPITAYVGGMGASGAYWIAAAADRVVANQTAILGSIGVRTALIDDSKWMEEHGFREYVIVSSQSPFKDVDPADESDRARVQQTVDDLAAVFVADVATYRGVSEEKVLADFGKGDVIVGQKAVDAGLADRLGDFEGTLEKLAAPQQPDFFGISAAPWSGSATTESKTMTKMHFSETLGSAIATATGRAPIRSHEQVVAAVAESAGIDQQTIDSLVAGERAPTAAEVRAIAASSNDESLLASLMKAARADGVALDDEEEGADDDAEDGEDAEDPDEVAEAVARESAAAVVEACLAAGMPDSAPSLIREGLGPDDARARLGDASAIRDLCTAAGVPSATADAYIRNGYSREQVKAALLDEIVQGQSRDITAHVGPDGRGTGGGGEMLSWDSVYTDA